MKTLLLLLSLQVAGIAAHSNGGCNQDNCLRAFEGRKGGDKAYTFCKTFTTAPVTATTGLPNFVSQCTGSTISRASSACSCFMKTYTPTGSQTATSTATTSKSTPSSTSTTSTTSSTTSPPTPTCVPFFALDGASEDKFNPASTPFSLKLSCNALNTTNYTVFANTETSNDAFGALVKGANATDKSIILPGFPPGKSSITVAAFDTAGTAILQSFSLLFGSITMPVLVVDESGAPVPGLLVTAGATVYPAISQNGTTDSTGIVKFTNLAPTTIGLFTQTDDNKIGVGGVAATTATVTIDLIPFSPASTTTDFNTSDGLTGWTGGTPKDMPITKRDLVLVIGTNAAFDLQTAHAEPKVHPFTKSVYIKYKFQTAEVPGGYFGTQFNDYFIVSIPANTGGSTAISRSMNELGLGAFDPSGATDWFTLTLPLPPAPAPKTDWVEFNVGVSNVADNKLDSQIIVDKIGDLTCDQCGSCDTCPGDPMCQPTCQDPPEHSCAFYSDCAEATVRCGAEGYPLAYGRKNCLAFQADLGKYTAAGQTFIWKTMHCLQVALRDAINCDSTCDGVFNAAFDSHPACYVSSGFCDLPPEDWWQLIKTVNTDLVSRKSLEQMIQTGSACAGKMITKIEDAIDGYLAKAADDIVNAAVYLAKAAVMRVLKKLIQDLTSPGPIL